MSEPSRSGTPLRRQVAFAATSLFVANLVLRGVNLISVLVLARLLSPDLYGVIALGMGVVGTAQVLTELQVQNVMIRKDEITSADLRCGFTVSLIRGVACSSMLLALAYPVSVAMHEPRLAGFISLLSLSPLLDNFRSPALALYAQRLLFAREAAVTVASKVLGLTLTISLAYWRPDVWAYAWGLIGASAAGVIFSFVAAPWRLRFGLEGWQEFARLGGWLMAAELLKYINNKADIALLGLRLTTQDVGQYNLGDQIASLATNQVAEPVQRSVYSGLVEANRRGRDLSAYERAQSVMMGVALPVGVGLSLVSSELTFLLAGPRWAGAAKTITFIAPTLAAGVISMAIQALILLRGAVRYMFYRDLLNIAVRLPVTWLLIVQYGFEGVLWARAGTGLLFAFCNLIMLRVVSGIGLIRSLLIIHRSLVAVSVMSVCVIAVGHILPMNLESGLLGLALELAIKVVVGAIAYSGVHTLLWHAEGRPDGIERMIKGGLEVVLALARRRLQSRPAG
jgi:PST family polysaccharide transporter